MALPRLERFRLLHLVMGLTMTGQIYRAQIMTATGHERPWLHAAVPKAN